MTYHIWSSIKGLLELAASITTLSQKDNIMTVKLHSNDEGNAHSEYKCKDTKMGVNAKNPVITKNSQRRMNETRLFF